MRSYAEAQAHAAANKLMKRSDHNDAHPLDGVIHLLKMALQEPRSQEYYQAMTEIVLRMAERIKKNEAG